MKKLLLSILILPLSYGVALGQDTPAQPAPEFPDYIVRPSEDLNPYGLSSLGTTTEDGAINDPSGSLGTKTTNRPSNREVNESIKDKKQQKTEQKNAQQVKQQSSDTVVEEEVIQYNEVSTSRPKNSKGMIKWVDNEGIVHITNNIGSVPPQYRDQLK